jgi:3-hydroxyisobutyrate dehydrogenase-like beta-hydroxyacid dehydrogenase
MEHMERIAFLGLGIMGNPMAKRLLAAGYPLTVWNRTASRAEPLQAEGADVAASPAEAVREADVVITMLADPTAVREVIDGIARHLRPGTTLIEASTIGPQALEEVAALLPGSVALVDAPVMGSADRAASGQLVVLAGGNLTKVRPILEVFGTVTECGAVGHGAALKVVLINAVIAGVTVVGEAMALGDALGLPEDLVTGALGNGPLAGIASRAFARGANYPLRLAAKDVALATASADLPLLRIVHDWLIAFPNAGSEDLGQIVRHIRAQRQDGCGRPAQSECDGRNGRLGCGGMPDDNADLSSPRGSASPGPGADARRLLERLSDAESLELLASGGLGRLVYNGRYGLMALPVAYQIDEGSIVLGTWDPVLFDEDLRTGIAQAEYQVAVEADQIDVKAREGWFVLVRGAAHHLDSEAERAPFIDAGLEPWVEGVPAHFIRVNPTSIWGNRTRRA